MNNYCRLCADIKTDDELNIEISDTKLKIHEKLVACCQWDTYQSNVNFPYRICYFCYERLEKSWLFSESIAYAQKKLQEVLHEIELAPVKCDLDVDDDDVGFHAYESEPEEIFVEPIIPSQMQICEKKEKQPSTKTHAETIAHSNEKMHEDKLFMDAPSSSFEPLIEIKFYKCSMCKTCLPSAEELKVCTRIAFALHVISCHS